MMRGACISIFRQLLPAVFAFFATATATAQDAPAFAPQPLAAGTLRIWGHPSFSGVVQRWAEGFRRFHPEITVVPQLMGSDTAVPGLYGGRADIALLGREPNITDENGFLRPKQYKYTSIELMGSSLDVNAMSPALAVLVHRDNPVRRMTLRQLEQAMTCGATGTEHKPLTWGELGASGEWTDKPVRLYLMNIESGTGLFLLSRITRGSRRLAWDRVEDFSDRRRADGSTYRAAEQAADALRADRYGLAISNLRALTPELAPVALAAETGGPFVLPTRQSVVDRSYPLARRAYAIIDRPPGKPVDPKVREFLRYALSREGQADIEREPGYVPLSAAVRDAQIQGLH
ncbi:PstS family phosphate ABC transporter substrate-binding protein [Rudaea sp.]|uniref:PstS family phosphate ABC transporter substrate-binding protein n=1 Tax=Rudaea sp. TaxID=2136325 RepID=UPI002ED65958